MNTYTIKPSTPEDFTNAFPSHLIKIGGGPSYDNLRQLCTTIFENAASVNSNLSGGLHGHLGMVMTPEMYSTLASTPWVDPLEPPAIPIIPAGATGPQINEAHRLHAQVLKERREFQNLDKALIRLIIDAIEPLFLKPIHQPYIGLLGKTTQQLLPLLMDSYGYIMPQELETNREKLAMPYDATSEPFQMLLDRFEEARTYAQNGILPITKAQLINSDILALKNTGVLERLIDLWNDKPEDQRPTWLAFKQHFQPKVLEFQKGRRTHNNPTFGLSATFNCNDTADSTISQGSMLYDTSQVDMANMATTQAELIQQLADMHDKYAALAAHMQHPPVPPPVPCASPTP